MREHRFRRRWWIIPLAVIFSFLFLREGYFIFLPADGWLSRGYNATRAGKFDYAEVCFQRAREKDPGSDLPDVALFHLYLEYGTGRRTTTRLGPFARIPYLGERLARFDEEWFRRWQVKAHEKVGNYRAWSRQRFGDPAAILPFRLWALHPHEADLALRAMRLTCLGEYARAAGIFAELESRHPAAIEDFCRPLLVRGESDGLNPYPYGRSSSPVLQYYAQATWRAGDVFNTQRLLHATSRLIRFAGTPVSGRGPDRDWLHNVFLSRTAVGAPARVWTVTEGRLDEHRQRTEETGQRLLLLPGPHGPLLFRIPTRARVEEAGELRWWQWDGHDWRAYDRGDSAALRRLLSRRSGGLIASDTSWPHAVGSAAWSSTATYLALRGLFYGEDRSLLLRLDGGLRQVNAQAPREIALIGRQLWVHGDMGFTCINPDSTVIEYAGRNVTVLGDPQDPFVGPQSRRASTIVLQPDWKPARDRAGTLWLVFWDGRNVMVKARWDNGRFRPPTAVEQQMTAQGFLDDAGRLWCTRDLPAGFLRDAWRPAQQPDAGLPARYAVDVRKRVWVICRGIAARWERTRWVSIANRIPEFSPRFDAIVAWKNGVFLTLPGQVCYLE